MIAGHQRNAGVFHYLLGPGFRAHGLNSTGRRANKDNPFLFTAFGKGGIFRQKPVARMNSIGAALFGGRYDFVLHQIALTGRGRANRNGFIGLFNMHGMLVGFRIHRYRTDMLLTCRGNNPTGNLATVGNQYFIDVFGD